MRTIRECSQLDYYFLFGESRTAFSDFAVAQAVESGGTMLLMTDENKPLGYVCMTKGYGWCRIQYMYTVPEQRRTGVCSALIAALLQSAQLPVLISVTDQHEACEAVRHLCGWFDFTQDTTNVVFRCRCGYEEGAAWDDFMNRTGNTFRTMLFHKGIECIRLSDADKTVCDFLYHSLDNEFKSALDPRPFLENASHSLDRTLSCVALKSGQPVAYTLVSRPDSQSAVFEQVSEASAYIGSGTVLLPFMESMTAIQAVARAGGCSRVAYTVYEDNDKANAFFEHLLKKLTYEKHKNYNYIYNKTGGSQ